MFDCDFIQYVCGQVLSALSETDNCPHEQNHLINIQRVLIKIRRVMFRVIKNVTGSENSESQCNVKCNVKVLMIKINK